MEFWTSGERRKSGGGAAGQLLKYNASEDAEKLVRKINAIQKYFVEESRDWEFPSFLLMKPYTDWFGKVLPLFPQAIGLAATFNPELMTNVSTAIARESKLRGIQILTPVVNLSSDVRWGRTEETYGEDPF